jgi:hypothetical protein
MRTADNSGGIPGQFIPIIGHEKACNGECECQTRRLLMELEILRNDNELWQHDLVNLIALFQPREDARPRVLSLLEKSPELISIFLDILRSIEDAAPSQWGGDSPWPCVCSQWMRSIVRKFDVWPNHILIKGVQQTTEHLGCGTSADVYLGRLNDFDVAIKRLRVSPRDRSAYSKMMLVSNVGLAQQAF